MNNFITRWMNHALTAPKPERSNNNHKKSFTLIPWPTIIEIPAPKAAPSGPANDPPIFDEMCVCAVHDKPFITRYVKQSDGKYLITSVQKVSASAGSAVGNAHKPLRLPVDKIIGSHPPCPWCGCNANKHYHCHCGGVVCGGRTEGDLFKCRPSCGAQWKSTTYVKEIKGLPPTSERKEYRSPGGATPKPAAPQSQPVTPNRLLLGAGSNVPARRASAGIDRIGGR